MKNGHAARQQKQTFDAFNALSGCGCLYLSWILFGLTIGALLFQYNLHAYFGADVPWYVDMLGGAFLSGILLPAALLAWILTAWAGHPIPIFQ